MCMVRATWYGKATPKTQAETAYKVAVVQDGKFYSMFSWDFGYDYFQYKNTWMKADGWKTLRAAKAKSQTRADRGIFHCCRTLDDARRFKDEWRGGYIPGFYRPTLVILEVEVRNIVVKGEAIVPSVPAIGAREMRVRRVVS